MKNTSRAVSRSRRIDGSVRENAAGCRAKLIRALGATIIVSWGTFFARVSLADDRSGLTDVRAGQAAVHACAQRE
jgi:hypothetical protein